MRTIIVAGLFAALSGAAGAHTPRAPGGVSDSKAGLPDQTGVIPVTVDTARVLNRFSTRDAFGAGVDGVPFHAVPEIYTPQNVRQMLRAGLPSVSYRLYTELSVQDWHWNPAGAFSERGHGYWTSSAVPGAKTIDTFGYRLPRRGNTHDQGNDDDYSRLDDGNDATIWKSNPYLTREFTREDDALHPQWVLVDLKRAQRITAVRINWAEPYATDFVLQYWTGSDPLYGAGQGSWVDFPAGAVANGHGGTFSDSIGDPGRDVRFVRVSMTHSSGTCPAASHDRRDCVGYAIAELGLGVLVNGRFVDAMVHSPDQGQTSTYASSTDPWHSDADRVRNQEQPGFDTVFDSGITRGLPTTVPVPMLYSTPENAAAEIAYLERRGDRIARVEMGEEPDGQFIAPEDYASLYLQFATSIRAIDPHLVLGGPVFESNLTDWKAWPNAAGQTSWTKRFLAYLAQHGRSAELGFFSFEHYPFNSCGRGDATQRNLLREPDLVADIMHVWRADGVPASVPIFITETSYSSKETDATQQPAGAIWTADLYGSLLAAGGAGIFLYEYEPIPLSRSYPCPGYGTYGLLLGDAHYTAQAPLAQFFAARMLVRDWAVPGEGANMMVAARVGTVAGTSWVTAYPLSQPGGRYSVLLVNRDLAAAHNITLDFTTGGTQRHFSGRVSATFFGAAQYGWIAAGKDSHPKPDGPAVHEMESNGGTRLFTLPKGSITVLSGLIK